MDGRTSAVSVRIPCRPELLHVLRTVAASVAGRLDFPYDSVDDLRLAVDEACAQLMSVPGPATCIEMSIEHTGDAVSVHMTTDAVSAKWPPEGLQRSLAWQVLSTLADEVDFDAQTTYPSIALTKRMGE